MGCTVAPLVCGWLRRHHNWPVIVTVALLCPRVGSNIDQPQLKQLRYSADWTGYGTFRVTYPLKVLSEVFEP
jgi:hypothetical protein